MDTMHGEANTRRNIFRMESNKLMAHSTIWRKNKIISDVGKVKSTYKACIAAEMSLNC